MIQLGEHPAWTKSTHSTHSNCVEVRSVQPEAVQVSDSKFPLTARPVFSASPAAFAAMVEHVRV